MKKIGIEYEMISVFKSARDILPYFNKLRKYGFIGSDGSVNLISSDYDILQKGNYKETRAIEFKTKPITFKNENELKEKLTLMFNDIFLNDEISINETEPENQKKINLIFNKTTGTHIHYSNFATKNKRITPELNAFYDAILLSNMVKLIKKEVKFKSITDDFLRSYTNQRGLATRYKQINVSNAHHFGTIEFRLFNLHGIKTNDFKSAMFQQISAMLKAIDYGFNYIEKHNKILESYFKKENEKPFLKNEYKIILDG